MTVPNAHKAPAAAERVAKMEIGREYTPAELKEKFGLYADSLARAVKHGMVRKITPMHLRRRWYVRNPDDA